MENLCRFHSARNLADLVLFCTAIIGKFPRVLPLCTFSYFKPGKDIMSSARFSAPIVLLGPRKLLTGRN